MTNFNRVEFTVDIYDEPKVLAFIQCTRTGISVGHPKRLIFTDHPIEGPDNYERRTIHRDGRIAHHLFTGRLEERTVPLAEWNRVMTCSWEFYDVGLSGSYLPGPSDSDTEDIPVQLQSPECGIWFAVLPSLDDEIPLLSLPSTNRWVLSDCWPLVVVGISNVMDASDELTEIHSVGLDFRSL